MKIRSNYLSRYSLINFDRTSQIFFFSFLHLPAKSIQRSLSPPLIIMLSSPIFKLITSNTCTTIYTFRFSKSLYISSVLHVLLVLLFITFHTETQTYLKIYPNQAISYSNRGITFLNHLPCLKVIPYQ